MNVFGKSLILRVLPIVCVVVILKILAHLLGFEVLSQNSIFSGIIAANVFLMGFLISGVLSDYKESEKLPGELAVSIEAIADEVSIIYKNKKAEAAARCLDYMREFTVATRDWLHKKRRTEELMTMLHGLNDFFLAFEPLTQANFIARLKQEQTNLRRMLIRIHSIRETSFVHSGYIIARATTVLLMSGLIVCRIDPVYESIFFVFVICFLLTYLQALIRSLDNPFGYYERDSLENVSLKPLEDLIAEMERDRPRKE